MRPLTDFLWDTDDWGGVMRFGPLVADERELRLLGNPAGKRVLLLGCGAGQAPATLAAAGARVIAVDPSPAAVTATRRHSATRGLAVEVQQHDLAELAFVRAETIDVAVSLLTLSGIADLGRVFRQVHRVLRADAPVVVSLPHPVLATLGPGTGTGAGDVRLVRAYGELSEEERSAPGPTSGASGDVAPDPVPQPRMGSAHTIEVLVTALTRGGFRLDTLLELMARRPGATTTAPRLAGDGGGTGPGAYWQPAMERVPAVLVVRARKMGL